MLFRSYFRVKFETNTIFSKNNKFNKHDTRFGLIHRVVSRKSHLKKKQIQKIKNWHNLMQQTQRMFVTEFNCNSFIVRSFLEGQDKHREFSSYRKIMCRKSSLKSIILINNFQMENENYILRENATKLIKIVPDGQWGYILRITITNLLKIINTVQAYYYILKKICEIKLERS